MVKIGNLITKSLSVLDSTDENRFFEGYLTVEMKDKQGEITVVDELYKVLPIWIDRGAPITDTHSNRVIGKGINFAKTTVTSDGVTYPAIKITGKIHKNYELDTDIWEKIKSGEYKGLSFGGATKANRIPKVMKDGEIAYALTDLEHYEVAVCKDPAVPLALITEFNTLAKATIPSEPRGDGKEIIRCDKFGCYVTKYEGKDEPEYHDGSNLNKEITEQDLEYFKNIKVGSSKKEHQEKHTHGYSVNYPSKKRTGGSVPSHHVGGIGKGEDFSNADIIPATVTNTVSQSTQVAKPIKTDTKVGKPEREGGLKMNVTPLEGGIKPPSETNKEFPVGTGGGVRANIPDGINRQDTGGSSLITEDIEEIKTHKSNLNKVIGAILSGAHRIKTSPTITESENAILDPDEEFIHDIPENAGKMQVIHDRTERARASVARGKKKAIEAIEESIKSLGALGWGKLNRDGTKQKLRKKQPKLDDFADEKKSGFTTEDGNIQLGNPSIPTENKEKLVSSLGAQNKQTKVTIRVKSDFCPNCGKEISAQTKRDYPETESKGAYCPSCRQDKQRKEQDRKDDESMEKITAGIHSDLASRGQKVTRFSAGKAPKTYN